ncbi:transporter substrate-binding domain-containing protein [Vibrio sp. CAU 1672]|uniref:transporter substrate-binding domain-containing protein n=1 Tax=Vibrio sp. CAU 1672 TaxID=3032594 RepID=UPI0023DB5F56|nr:transporter substrate-binding domain-containing protein [Vibrio sp. CAU 1672]MDF2152638.1 transporter substrate-binding domain-containing protein [Vibrio sp. CAU 1672]
MSVNIRRLVAGFVVTSFAALLSLTTVAADLQDIKQRGVLRHIGVPYANFVSYLDQGGVKTLTGLDVEIVKGFAESLGVSYEYVPGKWSNVIGKLTGQNAHYVDKRVVLVEKTPIEGDLIANGMTILDWRKQMVDFSEDYFPSGVWLVARSDSTMQPIKPKGSIDADISEVKLLISGRKVLALQNSCLDPNLYDLYATGAQVILPDVQRRLNEMVPAIMKNDAESTLLDVADTIIALEKWPGEIKVIGPISGHQQMAVAFRKSSPELRAAFNQYLNRIHHDGTYQRLVEKYYPSIYYFYNDYFSEVSKN